MFKNKNLLILVFLGFLIGIFLVDNFWVIFYFLIVIFCIIFLKKRFPEREYRFLINLFLISLFLRIFVVILIRPFIILYGNGIDLFGDSFSYGLKGFIISETLKRDLANFNAQVIFNNRIFEILPINRLHRGIVHWVLPAWTGTLPSHSEYQVTGYAYFLSALYYFFGFKPVLGILVNCLFGSLLPVSAYSITKKITNSNMASAITALLTAFFPSLFFWSITNLRDTVLIFLNLIIILCWINIFKKKNWLLMPVIILLSLVLYYFRTTLFYPMVFYYISMIFMLFWAWISRKRIILSSFIILIFFLASFIPRYTLGGLTKKIHQGFVAALISHKNQAGEKGTNYKILREQYYQYSPKEMQENLHDRDIFLAYFKGLAHLVFEPLPSKIDNFRKILFWPETCLLYFMLPFFIIGLFIIFKYDPVIFTILFLNLVVFSSLIILSEGNVGGLVRHRDMMMPIFIIFSTLGLLNIFGIKKEINPSINK